MPQDINLAVLTGTIKACRFNESRAGPVLDIRLIVERAFRDKEGKPTTREDWLDAVVWGVQARSLSTLVQPGTRLLVRGRLEKTSHQDGAKKVYETKLRADTFFVMSASAVALSEEDADADPLGDEERDL
jgi:single-stranded DNA-binding protein